MKSFNQNNLRWVFDISYVHLFFFFSIKHQSIHYFQMLRFEWSIYFKPEALFTVDQKCKKRKFSGLMEERVLSHNIQTFIFFVIKSTKLCSNKTMIRCKTMSVDNWKANSKFLLLRINLLI